jgi:hypothetical protein
MQPAAIGVCLLVLGQVATLGEGSSANVTRVGFLARMDAFMNLKSLFPVKWLFMQTIQLRITNFYIPPERTGTVGTLERPFITVQNQMLIEAA